MPKKTLNLRIIETQTKREGINLLPQAPHFFHGKTSRLKLPELGDINVHAAVLLCSSILRPPIIGGETRVKTANWKRSVFLGSTPYIDYIPSRGLTYPTLGKGKSSSKCHFWGIC